MTKPLSPAARTIVQAFDERHELLGPLEGNWQEACLAAALRATVQELKYFGITEKNILAIATELENSNV